MDRALQERLVGAAVLVALGVWLIPWVLDGSARNEPEQSQNVAVKLPAPADAGGTVLRRRTIELGSNRGTPIKSVDDEPRAGAQTPAPPVTVGVEPEPDISEKVPADAAEPPPVADAEPAERVAAQAATEPSADSAPQIDTADTNTESVSDPPEITPATRVAGWMVQLGSFSDAGNAKRQAQRVGTYGHNARIYEFAAAGGRTMFRVRLGPLETRESAQAAASSLAAHGFVAQLVAPE